ncbi:hypothetical protein [Pseudoduganella sp. UC29_71]|uniref:hypothetical protein n=1 Tax=Pseudoduganella sp. UC29_71 TaxID=3350174 RepID=UPI0036707D91
MKFPTIFKAAGVAAAATFALNAQADSFASSASSAGSASSGSISTSLNGSSNSSSGDKKTAGGPYHIIQMAAAPGKADTTRLTMEHDASKQLLVLDLPASIAAKEGLELGGVVLTQPRSYGFEFAHADTQKPFFLVLEDDWHSELAARPVSL